MSDETIITAENPYDSPEEPASAKPASAVPLMWSVATVFGSAIIGTLLGLGLGTTIATIAPGYYRSVISGGDDPGFDPMAVGIGLGLSQGFVFGGIIGLVLVGLFYWYRTRTTE
ncbi:MAG: hypothetical protein ACKVH8_19255 [Pirellulales bacterium]